MCDAVAISKDWLFVSQKSSRVKFIQNRFLKRIYDHSKLGWGTSESSSWVARDQMQIQASNLVKCSSSTSSEIWIKFDTGIKLRGNKFGQNSAFGWWKLCKKFKSMSKFWLTMTRLVISFLLLLNSLVISFKKTCWPSEAKFVYQIIKHKSQKLQCTPTEWVFLETLLSMSETSKNNSKIGNFLNNKYLTK